MAGTPHRRMLLAATACLVLDAGAISRVAAQPAPLDPAGVARVAFVGNSITLHGPKQDIDWDGSWGMAATQADRDYVHRLVHRLEEAGRKQLATSVRNLADFERDYAGYDLERGLAETVAFRPDLVIVALGENVAALTTDEATQRFEAAFQRLLERLRRSADGRPIPIIVRGTFWHDAAKDGAMARAAKKTGAAFVSLEGLDRDESNYGRSERPWKHAGVAAHPGDRGMENIADRIWSAIKPAFLAMPPPSDAAEPNHDEAAVRPFTLPDVLAGPDGTPAGTAEAWQSVSRPHQLGLLEKFVYGRRLPAVPVKVVGDLERADVTLAGDVPAKRIQARLRLGEAADAKVVEVLVYLPVAQKPTPVFLELNFAGNQSQHPDPGIWLSRAWMRDDKEAGIVDHRATAASRGRCAHRFPAERMLARGYGMATAYYGDLFPDRPDGRAESVLVSLGRPASGDLPPDEPGAIAAWAWGLSRILDWLVTLPEVDAAKVAVVGHSRLGKTALWAAACDARFAMAVANESGCGGAALERRNFGETVAAITQRFPHWFCPAFATFAGREADLPVDAHVTLAMTAPRPLYVASAIEDAWADPRGEFLAAVAAEPAWKLFGLTGLGTADWPPVDTPVGRTVGYHVRSGRHELLEYDWQRFADFADRTLRGRVPLDGR